MEDRTPLAPTISGSTVDGRVRPVSPTWERPRFEVISLDCEITSYAPDGDGPLF